MKKEGEGRWKKKTRGTKRIGGEEREKEQKYDLMRKIKKAEYERREDHRGRNFWDEASADPTKNAHSIFVRRWR